MGRAALESALAVRPNLRARLQDAHANLVRVIAELAPYVPKEGETGLDPDLGFQLHILRQAAQELEFMLDPDREG